jgi:hypothetical protein
MNEVILGGFIRFDGGVRVLSMAVPMGILWGVWP